MASELESLAGTLEGADPDGETLVHGPEGIESKLRLGRAIESLLDRTPEPVRIGRYAIRRRLGAGGMSLVYAAHDEALDREVAIKLLQRTFATAPGWRGRLRREALSMAKLSHVNVAHVYEVGDHEGRPFIAMELVRGPTLRQWLDERERSVPEIISMFVQAARGLAAAHQAGLVHRDFKPDNVIIDPSGWARVLDFGLVLAPGERVTGDVDRTRDEDEAVPVPGSDDEIDTGDPTLPGTVVGTPAYMAPEQMRGREIDGRADQFAFCVALYEALHGRRPFAGRSLSELATAIESGSHSELPITDVSRVPDAIADVIERGLSADPAARYPTMNALIDALTVAQQQRERTALEQAAVDRDFTRNRDVRQKLLLIGGIVLGGAAAVLTVGKLMGIHQAGYADAFVVLSVLWIVNLLYRRKIVAELNTINRRWHLMTMIIPPLLLVHFGLCAWAQLDFTTSLALASVLGAGVFTGASAMVDHANPMLPGGLLVTAALILAWPEMRGPMMFIGMLLTFVGSRWVLARRGEALQTPDR